MSNNAKQSQIHIIKLKIEKGFTLVELSIVIVIIGLIVAGITTGKSLVKQAQVRAMAANVDKIKAAINAFKLQYNGLPGDINNASSYWSGAANPGNNNGKLEHRSQYLWADNTNTESYAAFQQLVFAGLLVGSYTGVNGSGPAIGVNLAPSGYGNNSAMWFNATDLWGTYPFTTTKLIVGGIANAGFDDYRVNVIDAANLDNKSDDGLPYSGNMITFNGSSGVCVALNLGGATKAQKLASVYQLTNPTDRCSVMFPITGGAFKPQ